MTRGDAIALAFDVAGLVTVGDGAAHLASWLYRLLCDQAWGEA